MTATEKPDFAKEIYEWVQPLVFAFVLIVLLFSFVAGRFSVYQSSMTDTLVPGETMLVSRLPYTPKRGDIVLFVKHGWQGSYNDASGTYNPLVKRVIGLPGDTVEYTDGRFYLNGEEQNEPYIREAEWRWNGDMPTSFTVPEGSVFVMGDNRNGSNDSRFSDIGFVDRRAILGRVVLRITPLSKFGPVAPR